MEPKSPAIAFKLMGRRKKGRDRIPEEDSNPSTSSPRRVAELRSPETPRRSPRLAALSRARDTPATPATGPFPRTTPHGLGRSLRFDAMQPSPPPDVDSFENLDRTPYVELQEFGVFEYPEGADEVLMEYFAVSPDTIFELDEVEEAIAEVEQERHQDILREETSASDGEIGNDGVEDVELGSFLAEDDNGGLVQAQNAVNVGASVGKAGGADVGVNGGAGVSGGAGIGVSGEAGIGVSGGAGVRVRENAGNDEAENEAADETELDEASVDEQARIRSFFSKPCCTFNCNGIIPQDDIITSRQIAIEEDYTCENHINHNTIRILGQLSALASVQRSRVTVRCMYRGEVVCRNFFLFVNHCGRDRYKRLLQQVRTNNLTPKIHGNVRNRNRAYSLEAIQKFTSFMMTFSGVHGLVLPGRTPSLNREFFDIKLLPSSFTQHFVYEKYLEGCNAEDAMTFSTFKRYWRQLYPNIFIQKPRTDLCAECHHNTTNLQNLRSLPESEKLELLRKSQQHLDKVMAERTYYRQVSKKTGALPAMGPQPALNFKGQTHYSFDYAQQVFLPHDPQQVGPLYFLTPYKLSLFGVACEPAGKFILYVVPESASSAGKGSNAVISLLHHFFENFGFGEEEVLLHADNCAGQNKNNFLVQYLMWRTMTGRHKKFRIAFLPVGHTKFAPDLYFGLVKKAYRRSAVSTLRNFKEAIERSCGNCVTVVLVGSEHGDTNIDFYDWQGFFREKAERVPGISDFFHFESTNDTRGTLQARKELNGELSSLHVFESDTEFDPTEIPTPMNISGLSHERKKYLYDKIRQFVPENDRDILCPPVPNADVDAEPSNEIPDEAASTSTSATNRFLVPSARAPGPASSTRRRGQRRCGYCRQVGHYNTQANPCPQKPNP